MDVLSGDISAMVFRHTVRDYGKDFSIDSRLLKVFLELDGKRNVGMIAQKLGVEPGKLKAIIAKLMDLNLIELDISEKSILGKDFFDFLQKQLSLALGPIADVLIEDEVADLGHDMSNFPRSKAAELVDLLAKEIRREDKKAAFKLNMVNKIKEKGM